MRACPRARGAGVTGGAAPRPVCKALKPTTNNRGVPETHFHLLVQLERHNALIKSIQSKVLTEVGSLFTAGKVDKEMILDVVTATKNNLVRREGYSSQFLMTGTSDPLILNPYDQWPAERETGNA